MKSTERVRDERHRDQPFQPQDLGRLCREHDCPDADHCMGHDRFAGL